MKIIQEPTYNIYFGNNSYKVLNSFIRSNNFSKVVIIVDNNTNEFCLPKLIHEFDFNTPYDVIQFTSGEINKNLKTCYEIWKALTKLEVDRNSLIINLGGGVVTDIGGFVSSTYKRGIKFINIPTTLLSMVDASIGGKTGIDLDDVKNQIGTIKFPNMVLIDNRYLNTLPNRDFNSGIAEMLKHGLISSKSYWNELKSVDIKLRDKLINLIHKSIEIKNSIVINDPNEKNIRKSLNFGHTLGHAIESLSLKDNNLINLLHGEAIAIGIVLESYLSKEYNGLSQLALDDIKSTIKSKFGIVKFNGSQINSIIELLIHDKKNSHKDINFTLIKSIGNYSINKKVDEKSIRIAFCYYAE